MTPVREGLVISPADGRVSQIIACVPPAELGLSDDAADAHLDLHERVRLPREPRAGGGPHHHASPIAPGLFLNAELDKASDDNERNGLVIETVGGSRYGVVQIAGPHRPPHRRLRQRGRVDRRRASASA